MKAGKIPFEQASQQQSCLAGLVRVTVCARTNKRRFLSNWSICRAPCAVCDLREMQRQRRNVGMQLQRRRRRRQLPTAAARGGVFERP